MTKTNAMRLLENAGIPFDTGEYEVDESDLSGTHAAAVLGLDPDCMHPYMWACKSHYYSTQVHFYNFPYAFGQLFAVGVYALYQKKGADFLPDYEKLLRMAGSGTVREVAASVGIDVADVNFWRTSLKVFEDKLARLEKLAGE